MDTASQEPDRKKTAAATRRDTLIRIIAALIVLCLLSAFVLRTVFN